MMSIIESSSKRNVRAREARAAERNTWEKIETYRCQKIWLLRQRTPTHTLSEG